MTTLYYVQAHAETDIGDTPVLNLDLLVEANDVTEIVQIWRDYYTGGFEEEYLDSAERVLQVWELPNRIGRPRALSWHDDVHTVPSAEIKH